MSSTEQPNFILIDGSYFIFYRFYAILNWFKLAKKEQTIYIRIPLIFNIFVDFSNNFFRIEDTSGKIIGSINENGMEI